MPEADIHHDKKIIGSSSPTKTYHKLEQVLGIEEVKLSLRHDANTT